MRNYADVEHVRVREHEIRRLADLPAALALRVAVVDRGSQPGQAKGGERAELILRERLGRIEIERALLRLAGDRVEHGQVEGERLAAGRAGGDDDVLAARSGVPGCPLVGVELVDPLRREGLPHARVQIVRKRREPRLARGLGAEVGDLLALEEIVPDPGRDAHRRARSATTYG